MKALTPAQRAQLAQMIATLDNMYANNEKLLAYIDGKLNSKRHGMCSADFSHCTTCQNAK